jgi:hypothetical protein
LIALLPSIDAAGDAAGDTTGDAATGDASTAVFNHSKATAKAHR